MIAFSLPDAQRIRLEQLSPHCDIVYRDFESVDDPQAQVLVAHGFPEPHRAPRLRWLQLPSAGVEHMVTGEWPKDVTVTNARGVYAIPMAEYVMWGVLAASQDTQARRAVQFGKRWPSDETLLVARRLRGQAMLIAGYGATGREVGRLAQAFGMRILAVRQGLERRETDTFVVPGTGDPDGSIPERMGRFGELAELAAQADYLVVALPLTTRTRGLIGSQVLGSLPPHAWVINVARGAVLHQAALVDALRTRRLAGAVLDVFEEEPLPPASPLWDLPNVIMTTHIAGGDDQSISTLTDLLSENLQRYLDGRPLLNVVQQEREY